MSSQTTDPETTDPQAQDAGTTYYYQSLTVGDPANCVGICTLWTPQDKIARKLEPHEYGRIGNLYSRDGINHLVRNVLANPVDRYIIVCGIDLTGSGEAFLRLATNGIDENHRIIGDVGLIDRDIPVEAINRFRDHVRLIDLRGTTDVGTLRATLGTLPHLPPFSPPESFPETPPKATTFPNEGPGHTLRGRRVANVWVQALAETIQFGSEISGPWGDRLLDLPNLVTVVTAENPNEPQLPDWLPITQQYLETITYPLLLSKTPPEGLDDTEGQRIFDFGGTDQVARMAAILRENPPSQSATAVLWNPATDHERITAPNLISLHGTVRQGKLLVTSTLRAIDMYRSWPETAFALRMLQYQVADAAGYDAGALTIVSHDAYVAEDAWLLAADIVEQQRRRVARRPRRDDRDPRGSFVVRLEGGEIRVAHYSREGIKLQEFAGTSAAQLSLEMMSFFSQIDHALHIGGELVKAEIALNHPQAHYLQDHPLRFD